MNYRITRGMSIFLAVSLIFGGLLAGNVEASQSKDECKDVFVRVSDENVYTRVGDTFNYQIRTTGGEPETFDFDYLPRGLKLDSKKGIISGKAEETGTYRVKLTAENDCSEDTAVLRIVVRASYGSGYGASINDANVTLSSTFIPNDEKGYVYLTEIPYTGAGDVLQLTLIGLALTLWGGALGFALLTPEKRERLKNVFARNRVLLAQTTEVSTSEDVLPLFQVDLEEDVDEFESEELQILRSSANEEKVLFSESALKAVVTKARKLGGPSLELLSTVIEGAKSTYPREDGFLKINNERIAEILA